MTTSALSSSSPQIIDRKTFLRRAGTFSATASSFSIIQPIKDASGIEFVPASPNFNYSYQDGIEIISTQRIACDNIFSVISNGNLDEAAFKIMQLNAQTRMGGKIILDTLQTANSSSVVPTANGERSKSTDAINTVKILKSQEKFAALLDISSDCETQISKALNGKLGATTPAQLKLLSNMKDLINAFDEFLLEFVEDTVNTSL